MEYLVYVGDRPIKSFEQLPRAVKWAEQVCSRVTATGKISIRYNDDVLWVAKIMPDGVAVHDMRAIRHGW